MRVYIIKRLLLVIPTLFLVTIAVFPMIRMIPGDVVDALMARVEEAGIHLDEAAMEAQIRSHLGLDVPVYTQYLRWLGVIRDKDGSFSGVFQGNLGESYWRPRSVVDEIRGRWPVTLQLGLMALIIAQLIALPIGIYSALRQDTWGDYATRSFAIMCISIPGFWLATLVIVYPSIWWGYMPPIMYVSFMEDPLRNLERFIIPAIVLGLLMAGSTMRITRTMMLEVLRQDYIRTAWAKGLRERAVVLRHALKNALIPVITVVGLSMPVLVGGTAVIERVFNIPGLGLLIVEATSARDYPVMSGTMLFFAVGLVFINLMVDLTYAYLDPKVQYK
ncbi:Glutathione transport system permease protein GsiC [subsurface metagenome]